MKLRLHSVFLLASLTLASCDPDAARKAARAETKILMERVEVLELDVKRATNEARAAERSLQTLREEVTRREKEVRGEGESHKKKAEEAVRALDEYKSKYRVSYRSRAKGQRIARLDCGEGAVFEAVEILALTPGELRYHHANGIATVALGRLEAGQREMLGYDPEEAALWLKEKNDNLTDEDLMAANSTAPAGSATKTKKPSFATGLRGRYQASLNELYLRGRALQSDRNCCPVHKSYQLADWAREASRLKQKLASLPSGS